MSKTIEVTTKRAVRPILCVDTGEVFPHLRAAADSIGITSSAMGQALKRTNIVCQMKWEFLTVVRKNKGAKHEG